MTVLAWIADIAPDIDNNNDIDKKNRFISLAKNEVSKSSFDNDDTYNLAVAYYACHLLELTTRDGNLRGALTSEKEGDLSKSYGGGAGEVMGNATQYLSEYKRLMRGRIVSFYINGC